jgi:methionine sulfoxide reductase heme-binding subunit
VHLTSSPVDWYVIRASGLAAYLLLTAAVAVGLGLAGRERLERWPRFAVTDVHRFLGLLVGVFVFLHVVTLAIDSFLPFSVAQIAVPFAASYRPLWTALGIVGAELLLALAVTNRFRHRLSYRAWRRAHYLNFAVWIAATAHGIGSGSDSGAGWNVVLYGAAVALVAGLAVRRVARARAGAAYRFGPELFGASATMAVVVPLLAIVPLGASHAAAKPGKPARAASVPVPRSVQETLTGTIVQQRGAERQLVSLTGRGDGGQPLLVRVDVLSSFRGVDSTSLQVEFVRSGAICTGKLTNVGSYSFDGSCALPDGSSRTVRADWSASGSGLRGRISATA